MKIIPIGIWGGYPKANEATSSFLIEQDGFHCLIDCGSGVLSSLQNYLPLENIDAVVISHYHADHIADIGSLQYSRLIQSYVNEHSAILPIYGHTRDADNFSKSTYKDRTIGVRISENQPLQIGPFTVNFCRTNHPVYCLAMKFTVQNQVIVLTADTGWQDELVDFAQNADLLICEANLYEAHVSPESVHLSGSQAGELARRANVKQLILTHLPLHGDIEDIKNAASQQYNGVTEIAQVGKVYTF